MTLAIKARTGSGIERIKPFNITVCHKPVHQRATFEFHYNQSMGNQIAANASNLFDLEFVCPEHQFSLHTKDKFGTYQLYRGDQVILNENNQIEVLTNSALHQTLYVKIMVKFELYEYKEITAVVCGTEEIEFLNEDFKQLNISYPQGNG